MDPVEVVVFWDDWSPAERLDALSEVANETLDAWGYDSVDTDRDGSIGESSAYDRENDSIAFGDDMLSGDDPFGALESTFHETGHAMRDQDGGSELLSPDDLVDWNDKSFDFEADDEDEEGYDTPHNLNPFHDDVNDFSGYMMDETLGPAGAGGSSPVPTSSAGAESAADANAPTDGDLQFEIDFENVTVTPEPSDSVSFDVDLSSAVVSA